MPLRVLSWNVHKCVGGLDRRYDPARTAATIGACAADLILLQEVAVGGSWYRDDRQIDVLGNLLGIPHRAFFVNVRFGPRRGAYGNAILSKVPLVSATNLDLTIAGRKARSVLHAEVRVPVHDGQTRAVHLFNLHLGLSERERREQLRRFLAAEPFARLHKKTPIVVAGDFNDVWGTLGRQCLGPAGFTAPQRRLRTFPAYAPMRALDCLYVRGSLDVATLVTVRTKSTRAASDHLPLLAELRLRD